MKRNRVCVVHLSAGCKAIGTLLGDYHVPGFSMIMKSIADDSCNFKSACLLRCDPLYDED